MGVGLGIGFIFAALFIFFKFIKRDVYGARVVHEIEFAEGGWLPAPPRGMKVEESKTKIGEGGTGERRNSSVDIILK